MNVFLCCLQGDPKYSDVPHRHWRENFKRSLERLGHTVLEPEGIDFVVPFAHAYERDWRRRYRAETSDALVSQVRRAHHRTGIDLMLSYFYSFHVLPDAIAEIRRLGIPAVNFFCDNLRQFPTISGIAPHFTLNWVPESGALPLYQRLGAPAVHLPMAADPHFYDEAAVAATVDDELEQVTFIGSADGLRTRLLANVLRQEPLPLQVYGNGWNSAAVPVASGGVRNVIKRVGRRTRKSAYQHWDRIRDYGLKAEVRHFRHRGMGLELLRGYEGAFHPPVSHGNLIRLARSSAVFLGINRCPHAGYPFDAPLVYSRLRDVEAPMMGACFLTEYCEDLDTLYDIDSEIAVYRNADELVEQATRLLRDASARRGLRKRGHKAARSRHTWERRFEVLFEILGLAPRSGVRAS